MSISNVGKYRALKSVPLPFNDDEDDEERWIRKVITNEDSADVFDGEGNTSQISD